MALEGRRVLFVSYNGMLDPLGQSQVIPYLRELADHERCSAATMSRRVREAIAAKVFTKKEMQEWFRLARDVRKAREEPAGGTQGAAGNDDLDGPTSTLQLDQGRSQSPPQGTTGDPAQAAGDTSDPTSGEVAWEEAAEELTPKVPSDAPVEPKEMHATMS